MNNTWIFQDAKNRFSEIVDLAITQGVQIGTRRGKEVVAVIPYEEYERLIRRTGSLAQFLLTSPLSGSELKIECNKNLPQTSDFEP
jgi:prevent-host-death family protein